MLELMPRMLLLMLGIILIMSLALLLWLLLGRLSLIVIMPYGFCMAAAAARILGLRIRSLSMFGMLLGLLKTKIL